MRNQLHQFSSVPLTQFGQNPFRLQVFTEHLHKAWSPVIAACRYMFLFMIIYALHVHRRSQSVTTSHAFSVQLTQSLSIVPYIFGNLGIFPIQCCLSKQPQLTDSKDWQGLKYMGVNKMREGSITVHYFKTTIHCLDRTMKYGSNITFQDSFLGTRGRMLLVLPRRWPLLAS